MPHLQEALLALKAAVEGQTSAAMADDPANPGAAAVLLYREVNTYDVKSLQTEYRRIKVLTDAGKNYADIEIPYFESAAKIEDIRARTTRPDGTSSEFQGQIFDRTVLKAKKIKVQVKAFTLPDIQKGSIIEYSYTTHFREKPPDVLRHPNEYIFPEPIVVPSANWVVQEELLTLRARFVVHPFPHAPFFWGFRRISDSVHPQRKADIGALNYSSKIEVEGAILRYSRRMEIKDVRVPSEQLGELRKLYRQMTTNEKARVVLRNR